jgi:autotransporter strand-loop-strand O-heptosyltransferase
MLRLMYNIHHIGGLTVDFYGQSGDVEFIDLDSGASLYKVALKSGEFARLNRKYLSNVLIKVNHVSRETEEIRILDELKGKRVLIDFDTKALGDTIAWIPYCRVFKEYYGCEVVVSTFHNRLFEATYPDLQFVSKGMVVENIFGQFSLGWFFDKDKEPTPPNLIPLQKAACNILCLPYQEIRPNIDFKPQERPIEGKYVCISIYSTSGLKLWPYWPELVGLLKGDGYRVFEISKEDEMMGVKTADIEGLERIPDTSFESTMNFIHHAEMYIGLSSGLSWLAWALRQKVVMIANFTAPDHEFESNTIRITNQNVCNGCWNDPHFIFDKGNWNFCPRHENTENHFQCHTSISASKVYDEIKSHL